MHPNDVKCARLTSNLMELSEQIAAYSLAESKRVSASIDEARESALMSVQAQSVKPARGRAAVVCWDLAHNPSARAFVIYELLRKDWDVDLVGPMWSRYGTSIWEPLQQNELSIRSFQCLNVSEFVPKAEALAASQHYDLVCVCKPRLPSLYLGALIKEASGCPLILDIDDHELSFFKDDTIASAEEFKASLHAALHEPFEELATRYAQNLVPAADALIVSNVALRERFGGHIVRHARDESSFRNSRERRELARHKLGIAPTDFALIFIGTPRPHKGVVEVAEALNELNDPDLVFHIVGTIRDETFKSRLESYTKARIVLHPDCAFSELPDLLAGADLVPLIQDVDHAISQYQIPAKISDALSLGIPVVATRTPPLEDLIASGAINETDNDSLKEVISRIKDARSSAGGNSHPVEMNQERRSFLGELGMDINRVRLEQAVNEARETTLAYSGSVNTASIPFGSRKRQADNARLPEALGDLIGTFREHYRGLRGEVLRSARERRGELSPKKETVTSNSGRLARIPAIIRSRLTSYDIAYFWKQNDSNLYGRRSDMIAKELVRSGRVRKMIHFDAPMSGNSVNELFVNRECAEHDQRDHLVSNLIDRQMGIFDNKVARNRTHVYGAQEGQGTLLGKPLYTKGAYVRYVNEQLEEHGMRARNTYAWFCPVVWDAPELIEKIGFRGVIADLIDDQRAWGGTPSFKRRLNDCYRDTLSAADLVFANCESLAVSMQSHAAGRINVVPNGAERFMQFPDAPVPDSLKGIRGPLVGYVGNLRDRIDWSLLHEVVVAMPDVSFVFFGPAGDNANAVSLAMHENVHMLGVVRYDELAFHLKALDVGLVPHLSNELTDRMNPLKVYNYFAAGLPIVSSEVANLEDLGSSLKIATNATDFITAIRESIDKPVDTNSKQWRTTMDAISWESRVAGILQIMDQSLHRSLLESA